MSSFIYNPFSNKKKDEQWLDYRQSNEFHQENLKLIANNHQDWNLTISKLSNSNSENTSLLRSIEGYSDTNNNLSKQQILNQINSTYKIVGKLDSLNDSISDVNQSINFQTDILKEGLINISKSLIDIITQFDKVYFLQNRFFEAFEGNLKELIKSLKIPEFKKERIYYTEQGMKYLQGINKDIDYLNDAEESFLKANQIEPKDYFTNYQLGIIYFNYPKKYNLQKSLEYLEKAYKYARIEKPQFINEIIIDFSLACYINSDTMKAAKLAKEAYLGDSSNLSSLFLSAKYNLECGNKVKAISEFSQLLEHQPLYVQSICQDITISSNSDIDILLNDTKSKLNDQFNRAYLKIEDISKGLISTDHRYKKLVDLFKKIILSDNILTYITNQDFISSSKRIALEILHEHEQKEKVRIENEHKEKLNDKITSLVNSKYRKKWTELEYEKHRCYVENVEVIQCSISRISKALNEIGYECKLIIRYSKYISSGNFNKVCHEFNTLNKSFSVYSINSEAKIKIPYPLRNLANLTSAQVKEEILICDRKIKSKANEKAKRIKEVVDEYLKEISVLKSKVIYETNISIYPFGNLYMLNNHDELIYRNCIKHFNKIVPYWANENFGSISIVFETKQSYNKFFDKAKIKFSDRCLNYAKKIIKKEESKWLGKPNYTKAIVTLKKIGSLKYNSKEIRDLISHCEKSTYNNR